MHGMTLFGCMAWPGSLRTRGNAGRRRCRGGGGSAAAAHGVQGPRHGWRRSAAGGGCCWRRLAAIGVLLPGGEPPRPGCGRAGVSAGGSAVLWPGVRFLYIHTHSVLFSVPEAVGATRQFAPCSPGRWGRPSGPGCSASESGCSQRLALGMRCPTWCGAFCDGPEARARVSEFCLRVGGYCSAWCAWSPLAARRAVSLRRARGPGALLSESAAVGAVRQDTQLPTR